MAAAPSPSVVAALEDIAQARSLAEVSAMAKRVSAEPATKNVLLYSRVDPAALAQAVNDTGFSTVDDTERATLLTTPDFLAKVGKLCGITGLATDEIALAVKKPWLLSDIDPNKAAAMAANAAMFGIDGDVASLQQSFWGQASADFVNAAEGDILLLLGEPAERVFWAVELPIKLANPGTTLINGQAAAELAKSSANPFADLVPVAMGLAQAFSQKAAALKIVGSTASAAGSSGAGAGKPAARIGDMHVCPMVTGVVPHVGGPIVMGNPAVLIGGMPAAGVGDMVTCVGPPDAIALGSFTVLIGGKPAARMGDLTAHGGSVILGHPTVLIA